MNPMRLSPSSCLIFCLMFKNTGRQELFYGYVVHELKDTEINTECTRSSVYEMFRFIIRLLGTFFSVISSKFFHYSERPCFKHISESGLNNIYVSHIIKAALDLKTAVLLKIKFL
jgi:hypothetical protein